MHYILLIEILDAEAADNPLPEYMLQSFSKFFWLKSNFCPPDPPIDYG